MQKVDFYAHHIYRQNKDLSEWEPQTDWYLNKLMNTYLKSVGNTPLFVVTSPQYMNWYDYDAQERIKSLTSRINTLWGKYSHIQIIDGLNWIPQDKFFNSSHFDEIGHQIMADQLYALIIDKLG